MNKKLILGTVQFGLDYGINNSLGKPSQKNIARILDHAYQNGMSNGHQRLEHLGTTGSSSNDDSPNDLVFP